MTPGLRSCSQRSLQAVVMFDPGPQLRLFAAVAGRESRLIDDLP
jgi:hypothetical protein